MVQAKSAKAESSQGSRLPRSSHLEVLVVTGLYGATSRRTRGVRVF